MSNQTARPDRTRTAQRVPVIPLPDQPIQYPPAEEPAREEELIPSGPAPLVAPGGPEDLPGVPSQPVVAPGAPGVPG